jgi:hypothetical protein
LQKEKWYKTITKHGCFYEHKRIYWIYSGMKQRCFNKKDSYHYKYYGGRGITICDEWLDKENGFTNFLNWAMIILLIG